MTVITKYVKPTKDKIKFLKKMQRKREIGKEKEYINNVPLTLLKITKYPRLFA